MDNEEFLRQFTAMLDEVRNDLKESFGRLDANIDRFGDDMRNSFAELRDTIHKESTNAEE
jgi:hypothetical protein